VSSGKAELSRARRKGLQLLLQTYDVFRRWALATPVSNAGVLFAMPFVLSLRRTAKEGGNGKLD
jgi:hypothetical protein